MGRNIVYELRRLVVNRWTQRRAELVSPDQGVGDGPFQSQGSLNFSMLLLPVVARELLIQARRTGTYWIRIVIALLAAVLMFWLFLLGATPVPTSSQGKALFNSLSLVAFVYCLFIGTLATADCLTTEKRDGTLRLLFLTDLKGYDVVLGKLVSSSLHCAYGLLVVVPMLAMALLFGGVSLGEIGRTALVLANTLFFSLAAGVFASALTQNDRKAVFGTILMVFILSAVPYELGYLRAGNFAAGTAFGVAEKVVWPSPVFAFRTAQSSGAMDAVSFYGSLASTHLIAWGLLGLSCWILPRLSQDLPKGRRRERWNEWSLRVRFGNPAVRAALRRRLLEHSPCCWLSSRERHKPALAWLLVGSLSAIGLWVCLCYTTVFDLTAVTLLFILHVMLKVWFIGETCHRWIEDRQSGALELLLCTPLSQRELLRGQTMALWRQFGWPVVVTLVLTLVSRAIIVHQWGSGSLTEFYRPVLLFSLPLLLADLVAARWVGAWVSLRAGGLNRAIASTMARVQVFRWVVYSLIVTLLVLWRWVTNGRIELRMLLLVWCAVALLLDLLLGWSARRKFLRYFRAIAASPMDFRASAAAADAQLDAPSAMPSRPRRVFPAISKRRRRQAVWAILLLSLVGMPATYRYWLSRQALDRIEVVRRSGAFLAAEQLTRQSPPFLNGTNAAEFLELLLPALVPATSLPPASQQALPNLRAASPNSPGPLTPATQRAMASFLAANEAALRAVHSAPPLDQARFANDWEAGGRRWRSQLVAFQTVSHLLQCEVWLRAEERDAPRALQSLYRVLELSDSLEYEPAAMFRGIRASGYEGAFCALERLLSRNSLSTNDLHNLRQRLNSVKNGHNLLAEITESQREAINRYHWSRVWTGQGAFAASGMEVERRRWHQHLRLLTGANDRELIQTLDLLDEFNRIAQFGMPEQIQRAQVLQVSRPPSANAMLSPWFISDRIYRNAEFVARCRAALTALGIEEYRLLHSGELPATLEQLVPDVLSYLYPDPFDGQPLRYRRLTPGYCVFSIGRNCQDDFASVRADSPRTGKIAFDDIRFTVNWGN